MQTHREEIQTQNLPAAAAAEPCTAHNDQCCLLKLHINYVDPPDPPFCVFGAFGFKPKFQVKFHL